MTTGDENESESYTDHYGLILDENKSFNSESNTADSYLARLDFSCCFCLITNKLRSTSFMYVPHADKIEYGTIENTENSKSESNLYTTTRQQQQNSKNDTCPICFETFTMKQKVALLDCKHAFHSTCIAKWLNKCTRHRKGTCPLCKVLVDTEIVYTNSDDGTYSYEVFSAYTTHYGQNRMRGSYALDFANV